MVGGVHGSGRGCVWQRGMCGKGCAWQGACMVGVCVAGGHAWQGAWKGDVHGRGHVWQEGMCGRGDMCGKGACMAGKTAIAAGGTHPTGMHSCFFFFFNSTVYRGCGYHLLLSVPYTTRIHH